MKTVIITQARMGSTRLPGKIFKPILNKTLLDYHLERLRRVHQADEVMVATTTDIADTAVSEFCRDRGIACFRGSVDNVLSRYIGAGLQSGADIVVRVTSDCPLIDPTVLGEVITFYKQNRIHYDYVSNILERRYPRGLDCEVFSLRLLQDIASQDLDSSEREHVTAFIYRHPERYRLANVGYPKDFSQYRWTVDTPEDFELIRRILETLVPHNPSFTWEDVLKVMHEHPEWEALNRHIEQKSLSV